MEEWTLWKGKSFRLINLRSRRRLFFFYMHKGLFFNLFVSLHKLKVFLLRQFEMILSCVKFSICYAFIFLTLLSLGCRSLTTFLQYISWIYFLVYDWHSWILTIWAFLRWRNNFKKFPFLSRFYLSIKRRTQKKIKVFFLASLRKMFSVHTPNTEQKKNLYEKESSKLNHFEDEQRWRRQTPISINSIFISRSCNVKLSFFGSYS